MNNLLSNAFKYTPENGEITVCLTTGHNQEYKGALKNYFEISVTDNGIGIDQNKIEQIFERFYQINNDVTQSNFGTGIGLHLSRSLVILHHGILFAENRTDGSGSRFIIRIPLGSDHLKANELENPEEETITSSFARLNRQDEFKEPVEETEEPKHPTWKSKSKPHILIVEDEEEIQTYLEKELAPEFRISSCNNGKEALEYVLLHQPDLVLSDVMMPEMDGITLCKKIRQNININHIPIVLLTAKSKVEDKIEGMETGADAYIVKPFNIGILKANISNLLTNRALLRSKYGSLDMDDEDDHEDECINCSQDIDWKFIANVRKNIEDNIDNPALTVDVLCNLMGMSRTSFYNKLRALTDQAPGDYIRLIRLKRSVKLLKEGTHSITEIAEMTGFSDAKYFREVFKKHFNVSPSQYGKEGKPHKEGSKAGKENKSDKEGGEKEE